MRAKYKNLLEKSRDSALLAVEIYNKPRTAFRSSGFIVLMNIAWTALFHSIFERDGIDYFYREDNGRFKRTDGDKTTFELSKCISTYFRDRTNTPVVDNLVFINKLRDKIEHRFAPELDPKIFGECQACLLNYEKLVVEEFGGKYCINENLSFSLQFSSSIHPQQRRALNTRQARDLKDLDTFINNYRENLAQDHLSSPEYSFRIYLFPKVGNHEGSSDAAVEFIRDTEIASEISKYVIGVKEKKVFYFGLRPKVVAEKVFEQIKSKMPEGWRFDANRHVPCWRYFKVRPPKNDPDPEKTDERFCRYNTAYRDYLYTDEWVAFLSNKLVNREEYKNIFGQYP